MGQDLDAFFVAEVMKTAADNVYQGTWETIRWMQKEFVLEAWRLWGS